MVKTKAADGTMLETAWESRWAPESIVKNSFDCNDIQSEALDPGITSDQEYQEIDVSDG